MNYIEQINNFWAKAEESDLTGLDIAVYMTLLKYCNKLNWMNPFVCHWDIVCQISKVSKNSYYSSMKRLELLGFIKHEKGVKNSSIKSKVSILKLKNKEGIIKEQNGNNEGTTQEQIGNLYKLINFKTNKLINIKEKDVLIILSHFDSLAKSELKKYISEFSGEMKETEKIPFDVFWNLYGKKEGDKDACRKKWDKLSSADQKKIIETLPAFKSKISDKQFQPLPTTYLNQKRWNDEISVSGINPENPDETPEEKVRREYIVNAKNIKVH